MKMANLVSLVLASHSSAVATGTKELAQAMAPDVFIAAVGGAPGGGLGSSFDQVEAALASALEASGGAGVVVLADIGSATLTVDAALEFADDPGLLRYAPGPFVEGTISAAVQAQGGGTLEQVCEAVTLAARSLCAESRGESSATTPHSEAGDDSPQLAAHVARVSDPGGLHARVAARLAVLASNSGCQVWVDNADAASVVELMSLGARQGQTVTIRAEGAGAKKVVAEIADGLENGFSDQSASKQGGTK